MKPIFCPQIVGKFWETFQRAYSLPPITTKNDEFDAKSWVPKSTQSSVTFHVTFDLNRVKLFQWRSIFFKAFLCIYKLTLLVCTVNFLTCNNYYFLSKKIIIRDCFKQFYQLSKNKILDMRLNNYVCKSFVPKVIVCPIKSYVLSIINPGGIVHAQHMYMYIHIRHTAAKEPAKPNTSGDVRD